MIDRIINSVIDTASPLVTKWRVFFFLSTIFLVSPKFENTFNKDVFTLSISESLKHITEVLSSSSLLVSTIIAVSVFIILPQTLYLIQRKYVSINLGHAAPLVDGLEKLRTSPKSKLEELISSNFDFQKQLANDALRKIEELKKYGEVSFYAPFWYTTISLYLGVNNIFITAILILISLASLHIVARRVLLVYLRDIAPFRILEDYIKYVVLIKQ